jgi:hypothetical protein
VFAQANAARLFLLDPDRYSGPDVRSVLARGA